jgi:antitoxin PrlF
MVKHMSETMVVSSRGQITLPAALRKRLGIRSGDVVILEERGNEVVLKPGIVLEVQHYSDEQIAQWDAEDKLSEKERAQILDTLATSSK